MNVIDYLKTRNKDVGRKALAQLKTLLQDNKPGLVAGTFHHIGGNPDADPKEWAKVLRVKEKCGEDLTAIQRRAWRDALGEKE